MARKIIIDLSEQPVNGKGFEYAIAVNTYPLIYDNGKTSVISNYSSSVNDDLNIQIQPTLSETIDNTIAWLLSNYVSPAIIYSKVGNTIEVLINSPEYLAVLFGTSNINIATTSQAVLEPTLGLRYYFEYTNIVNDMYLCNILKKGYSGDVTEIHGKAIINKGSVKDHLEPIRGGGVTLELEADLGLTLEDLYTENEQDFKVNLYKNNKLIFAGYLNPEGLYQSFTRDSWIITLDCVDGLGSLANLSFVDPLGFPFTQKMITTMKAIDIVYYALNRSGIILPINVSINTTYDGLLIDADTEILSKIYLNSNRFQKTDGQSTGEGTIMSCEEVLKSVLDLFCACITQKDGEWYIYKPNEIFQDRNVIFKIYDINNVYLGRKTIKMDYELGSQINNFYPHHCNGDQKIQIKGANSSFRINYKYGFVASLISNPNLNHDNLLYEDWTIYAPNASRLINDPIDKSGLKIRPFLNSGLISLIATSDSVPLNADDIVVFKVSLTYKEYSIYIFRVRSGSYYMSQNGSWTLDSGESSYIQVFVGNSDGNNINTQTTTVSITSSPLINTANTFIEIFVPAVDEGSDDSVSEINSADLTPRVNNIEGEFHTASRKLRVSSNIKDNKTIYNGDNNENIYLGAIFKEDGVTPTSTWNRKNSYESSPILKIAAEEELRISQRPLQIFDGSVYGQLPYLSVISINGLNGVFMSIEYSYDTMLNVSKMKLLELFSSEISDLDYKFTYDYGETVKPTIQG